MHHTTAVCTFFPQGTCLFGATCRFRHELNSGVKLQTRQVHSGGVCEYYQQGTCRYGNTCKSAHTTNRTTSNRGGGAQSQGICPHFLRGECRFGERCNKSHDITSSAIPKNGIASQGSETRTCPHFLRGSCRFGDACLLSHCIKNLPLKQPECRFFTSGRCNRADCSFLHERPDGIAGGGSTEIQSVMFIANLSPFLTFHSLGLRLSTRTLFRLSPKSSRMNR